jgi:hypothetical protein
MRTRIFITVVTLISLFAYTGAASVATFSAETKNPSNKFSSGTLVLSDTKQGGSVCLSTGGGSTDSNVNNSCTTLLSATGQKPGDSATANVTIQNVGSLNASAFKLYTGGCSDADNASETYHGTGSMCSNVQLYIQQWTNSDFTGASSCLYGGTTVANTCDFSDGSKTMGTWASAHASLGTAQSIGSGLNSATSAYFTIGVKLPTSAGNSLQGRQASMDFTWHIDQ